MVKKKARMKHKMVDVGNDIQIAWYILEANRWDAVERYDPVLASLMKREW